MRNTWKKTIGIFLSIAMVFSVLQTSAYAFETDDETYVEESTEETKSESETEEASSESEMDTDETEDEASLDTHDDPAYWLYVNGRQVNENNANDVLGDGTVSYDDENGVLTLNGATITVGFTHHWSFQAGIYMDGDLWIVLKGENSISLPDSQYSSYGIYANGDVMISGEGTLTVESGNTSYAVDELDANTLEIVGTVSDSIGIYAGDGLNISEASITAKGKAAEVIYKSAAATETTCGRSCGICTYGGVTIKDDANVSAYGGPATGGKVYSHGISVWDALGNALRVTDANVSAYGGNANSVTNSALDNEERAESCGVFSYTHTIEVDDEGYLEARGGKAIGTNALSLGVYGYAGEPDYSGSLDIDNGYLLAYGGTAEGTSYAMASGVCLQDSCFNMNNVQDNRGNNVIIEGGTAIGPVADATGMMVMDANVSIYAGTMNITGGSYTASNKGYASALCVEGSGSAGKLTIASDSFELNLYAPGFIATQLILKAENDIALEVENGVDMGDEMAVVSPANGKLGKGKNYTFIFDADGNDVSEATIGLYVHQVHIIDGQLKKAMTVPHGYSVNGTYCEHYHVEDMSPLMASKKEGYVFAGWYTDEACTDGNKFSFDETIEADVTIYPKWVKQNEETKETKETEETKETTGTTGIIGTNNGNKPSSGVKTGDKFSMMLWSMVMLASGILMFIVGFKVRKRR